MQSGICYSSQLHNILADYYVFTCQLLWFSFLQHKPITFNYRNRVIEETFQLHPKAFSSQKEPGCKCSTEGFSRTYHHATWQEKKFSALGQAIKGQVLQNVSCKNLHLVLDSNFSGFTDCKKITQLQFFTIVKAISILQKLIKKNYFFKEQDKVQDKEENLNF